METQTSGAEVIYNVDATNVFWPQPGQTTPKFELIALKRESQIPDFGPSHPVHFRASPNSSSPGDSSPSIWSVNQNQQDGRYGSPTSYSGSVGTELIAIKQRANSDISAASPQAMAGISFTSNAAGKRPRRKGHVTELDRALKLKDPRSFDQYTLFFLNGYSPFGSMPAPTAEQKHQINMLSSMDIFLKTRLNQDDSVCGPIDVVDKGEHNLTIFEEPFNKFWAVFYLLEAGKMDEAFNALDDWCEFIKGMLRTQQPPLLSLMSIMYDEFRQMGRPEIADRVLTYLTGLAEVYFGKRHPMSVMLWCLRASNLADETALPEVALERAVEQLGEIQHEHIVLLLEDFKFRWTHILRQRHKTEEAVVVLREMVSEQERVWGPTSPKAAEPVYVIARTYYAEEQDLPAVAAFQEVLQRVGDYQAYDYTWLRACAHGRLALIYKRLGYDLQARSHALSLLSEAGKIWDKDHPQRKVWLARLDKGQIL